MTWRDGRDIVIVVLVGLSLLWSAEGKGEGHSALSKVERDEHATSIQSAHTRKVQRAGEPTGVCLREAAKAALPILVDGADALEAGERKAPLAARAQIELFVRLTRSVERPLDEYVRLQSHRYPGVSCSDK